MGMGASPEDKDSIAAWLIPKNIERFIAISKMLHLPNHSRLAEVLDLWCIEEFQQAILIFGKFLEAHPELLAERGRWKGRGIPKDSTGIEDSTGGP